MTQLTVVVAGYPALSQAISASGRFAQVVAVESTSALRDLLVSQSLSKGVADKVFLFSDATPVDTPQSLGFLIGRLTQMQAGVIVVATTPNARALIQECPGAGLLEGSLKLNQVIGAISGMPGLPPVAPVEDAFNVAIPMPGESLAPPQQAPAQPASPFGAPAQPASPFAQPEHAAPVSPFGAAPAQPTPMQPAAPAAPEPVQPAPPFGAPQAAPAFPAQPAPTPEPVQPASPFGAPEPAQPVSPFGAPQPQPVPAQPVAPAQTAPEPAQPASPFGVSEQPQFPSQPEPAQPAAPFGAQPAAADPFGAGTPSPVTPFGGQQPAAPFGAPEQPQWGAPAEPAAWGQPEAQPAWGQQPTQPAWGQPEAQPAWGQVEAQPAWGQPAQSAWGQPEQQVAPAGDPWAGAGEAFGAPAARAGAPVAAPMQHRGFVITVAAPKGGTGKSTMSLNLAAYLGLRLRGTGKTVCLIDANVQQADTGKYLNAYTPNVEGVLKDVSAIHPDRIMSYLLHKPELNMSALLGPTTPEVANPLYFTGARYAQILDALKPNFDYIIIDTPVAELYHDMFVEFALPKADFIATTIAPNVATLMNTDGWLRQVVAPRAANGMGVDRDKIGIVLNRAQDDIGMSEDEVRRELGEWRYLGAIPETKEWQRCNNRNEVVATKNYHELNEAFATVLYAATGEELLASTPAGLTPDRAGLGGLMARIFGKKG